LASCAHSSSVVLSASTRSHVAVHYSSFPTHRPTPFTPFPTSADPDTTFPTVPTSSLSSSPYPTQ
jgi:hypothetical protein